MNKGFIFNTSSDFNIGIQRLSKILGFDLGYGIEVSAEPAECNGVILHNNKAVIKYNKKHRFFRQLGILFEHAEDSDFEHTDDGFFTEVSAMIDCSRGAVPTVETFNTLIDYLALMGYGAALLYAEDMIKLEAYPYFGYMRGRYTEAELKAMDDYAFAYGIELIPCLECYGHMERYLRWKAAAPIKDTARILLAREEKTFELIEALLTQTCKCFRSRRVHIGMDEAADMGRGAFLNKHGYVPAFEIFGEYMERLISITNRLGLSPMMWSDMYFRNSSATHAYYDENIVVSPEVANKIPDNVDLIFWHYGEEPHCDDYMLKKHKALGQAGYYCGGLWSWCGHFPEHNYMIESVDFSLKSCRSNDVRRAMITLWLDDNAECDIFANLFGFSYFAERCYNPNIDKAALTARFESLTGGIADAFVDMSEYHNRFADGTDYSDDFNKRFLGKSYFYSDLLEGLLDYTLELDPLSCHYANYAEKMSSYKGEKWQYLYDFAQRIFAYLSAKTSIHERLVPAYKSGNREVLSKITNEEIPNLKAMIKDIYEMHRKIWHQSYKPFGWRVLDERYGYLICRCDTAVIILNEYLTGKCDSLPQLDEPRLFTGYNAFRYFPDIVM